LRCAGGRELAIKQFLSESDFPFVEFFVPMMSEWRTLRHRKTQKETRVVLPAFQGYLFAVGAGEYWKHIRDHRKVIEVLCYETRSGWLKPYEINADLVEVNYVIDRPPPPVLKIGSAIRVVEGPFTGLNGVVVENGHVEIDMFGRRVKIKIPHNMIILIQGFPSSQKKSITPITDELVDQQASM
jgi:transcription antitermination factor NusG